MTDLMPAFWRGPLWPRPRDVIRELAGLLRMHGVSRLYGASCARYGVLSLPGGLTVWFGLGGELLSWHWDAAVTSWPAADTTGAAQCLAALLGRTARMQLPGGPTAEASGAAAWRDGSR
jgi:hypothetical protein